MAGMDKRETKAACRYAESVFRIEWEYIDKREKRRFYEIKEIDLEATAFPMKSYGGSGLQKNINRIGGFLIQAREQSLKTNYYRYAILGMRRRFTPMCDLCGGNEIETQVHVFSSCIINRTMIIERHDASVEIMVDVLKKKYKREEDWDYNLGGIFPISWLDRPCPRGTPIKPDILCYNFDRKELIIVEHMSPYDFKLNGGYSEKKNVYDILISRIKRGIFSNIKYGIIVIGTLGAVHEKSVVFVSEIMDVNISKAREWCKIMSFKTILKSKEIWNSRIKYYVD